MNTLTLNNPLITIIIPIFNTRQYLPSCLDSVLGQSHKNFEVILIDDGSTDGSGELCDYYASIDKRVKCIHQENSGVSSARNTGLEHAIGHYIWFCDSDDAIAEGALHEIAEVIAEYAPKLIAFPIDQIDSGGRVIGHIPAPEASKSSDQGPLQCGDQLFPYAHVVSSELIGEERFDTSLSLLEDRDFFYRIVWKAAGDTRVISRPLYRYLVTRTDSAINSSSVSKYVDATRVQANILSNEESLGHVMPAFAIFAEHSIGVLSLVVRSNASCEAFNLVRDRLVKYNGYAKLLEGRLRLKYLLAVRAPFIFSFLTKVYGLLKRETPGMTVLQK